MSVPAGEAESVTAATMRRVREEWEAPLRARPDAAEKVVEAARKLHVLHVKRDQMVANDMWESIGAIPTMVAIENAEAALGAAVALWLLSASSTDKEEP